MLDVITHKMLHVCMSDVADLTNYGGISRESFNHHAPQVCINALVYSHATKLTQVTQ